MKNPYKPYTKERSDYIVQLKTLASKARVAENGSDLQAYRNAVADLLEIYAIGDIPSEKPDETWIERAKLARQVADRVVLDDYLFRLELGIDARDRIVRRDLERMVTGEDVWNAEFEAIYFDGKD